MEVLHWLAAMVFRWDEPKMLRFYSKLAVVTLIMLCFWLKFIGLGAAVTEEVKIWLFIKQNCFCCDTTSTLQTLCIAGASFSANVGYVLGYPFLNDTILNETMWMPRQWYDYDDMNISDFMMYMFSSFATYGSAPTILCSCQHWYSTGITAIIRAVMLFSPEIQW